MAKIKDDIKKDHGNLLLEKAAIMAAGGAILGDKANSKKAKRRV